MEAIATLEDYEKRYGSVSADKKEAVETRLLDATGLILSELPSYQKGTDEILDVNVVAVCCEVVHRAIIAPDAMEGIKQASQTGGSYNASVTFSNPDNVLYLTSANKDRLGCNCSYIGVGVMISE